jgi:hypothetical protein
MAAAQVNSLMTDPAGDRRIQAIERLDAALFKYTRW